MPWSLTLHEPEHFVEIIYQGTVNQTDLKKSAEDSLALARSHAVTRVLADCRELEGGHSMADLYFLSDWLVKMQAYKLREAVLLPVSAMASDHARFWETTCINRGLNVKVFDSRDAALEWLTKK